MVRPRPSSTVPSSTCSPSGWSTRPASGSGRAGRSVPAGRIGRRRPAQPGHAHRRAPRSDPERPRADAAHPRPGLLPRPVAGSLGHRDDRHRRRRTTRPAGRRPRPRSTRSWPTSTRPSTSTCRAPISSGPTRACGRWRPTPAATRLHGQGVARAPHPDRPRRARPDRRRQVHDVPADGAADRRRRARPRARGAATVADRRAALVGAAPRSGARRAGREAWRADAGLDRPGPAAWSLATGRRRRPSSRSATSWTSSPARAGPRRISRPRSPGRPGTRSRCRSTTSCRGALRLAQEQADRGAAIAPRVAELHRSRARLVRRPPGPLPSTHTWPRRTASTTSRDPAAVSRAVSGPLILALDQGTTSSRALAFGRRGRTDRASAPRSRRADLPGPGRGRARPRGDLVDPAADRPAGRGRGRARSGRARSPRIGVTNQRETTIVWDRSTGRPVANAIVWQSRVTAPRCDALRAAGHEPLVRARTGPAPRRLLQRPEDRRDPGPDAGSARARRARRARLRDRRFVPHLAPDRRPRSTPRTSRTPVGPCCSTSTGWPGTTSCAASSACRGRCCPRSAPPRRSIGETDAADFGRPIPIAGCAGDQQAATFGQACFGQGSAKNDLRDRGVPADEHR